MTDNLQRRLFQGFVCLLILKMAGTNELYGAMILDELEQVGYRLSPGTLYPILRQLQQDDLLTSYEDNSTGKPRRYYSITVQGKKSLFDSLEYLDFLTNYMSGARDQIEGELSKTGTDNV
ncbi:MAG: helix-turn-helix transcriptional regulator [Clostridiaceae bacterium]|nr:helix-turn-helix transcriptional regulator [Clostridiaceae bacterium]